MRSRTASPELTSNSMVLMPRAEKNLLASRQSPQVGEW